MSSTVQYSSKEVINQDKLLKGQSVINNTFSVIIVYIIEADWGSRWETGNW